LEKHERVNFKNDVCIQGWIGSPNLGGIFFQGAQKKKFAGTTHNVKTIIGTSNQPIRLKNFPKKVCLVP
jgi:hypothetical protein